MCSRSMGLRHYKPRQTARLVWHAQETKGTRGLPPRPRLLVVPDRRALFQEGVHTLNHVFCPGQFTKVEFLRTIERFFKVTTGPFAQGALGQGEDSRAFSEESFDVIIDGFSQSCPGDDAID